MNSRANHSTVIPDFGYAGMYVHNVSGLNLTWYRPYDVDWGWLSRDPLGEQAGLNLYDYVGNNPINAIDPDGRFLIPALIILLIVVGGATAYYKADTSLSKAAADNAAAATALNHGDPSGLSTLGQGSTVTDFTQSVSDAAKEASGFTSAGGTPVSIPDGSASDAAVNVSSTALQSSDDIANLWRKTKDWWRKKNHQPQIIKIWQCQGGKGINMIASPDSPGPGWTLVKTITQ